MKVFFFIISITFFSPLNAVENLKFYTELALKNNLKLNAERKNLESTKQSKKISRSEFLPSLTIEGNQTSTTSTNKVSQSGGVLSDSNLDTA